MLLALDTATRHSGLALFDGQNLIAELNWYSADGQTSELLPRLDAVMHWHGLNPVALSGLAVSLGPGSFTGLRVALSVAKGMALAHDIPLLGIPTLDATAYPHLFRPQPVCAIIQAGRGRVCWAIYRPEAAAAPDAVAAGLQPAGFGAWSGWRSAYQLSDMAALAAAVPEPAFFAGELTEVIRKELAARLGSKALLAPPSTAPRRAGVLAELAWRRLQGGERDDAASLSPIYLREP